MTSNSISQQHARIDHRDGLHYVTDLGSTNGTRLNGDTLSPNETRLIEEGDTLSFAEHSFVYLKSAGGSADAPELTQALPRQGAIQPVGNPNKPDALLAVSPELPPRQADLAALVHLLQMDGAAEPARPTASIDDLLEKTLRWLSFAKRYTLLVFVSMAASAVLGITSVAVAPPLSEASCVVKLVSKADAIPIDKTQSQRPDTHTIFESPEDGFVGEDLIALTFERMNKRKATPAEIKILTSQLKMKGLALSTYQASLKNRDPKYAVAFLDSHLKNYIEAEITKALKVAQAQVDFLSNQVRDNEAELRKTETSLREFKQQNLDGLPEYAANHVTSREELYTKQSELRGQLEKTNLELSEARRRLSEMRFLPEAANTEAAPYKVALVDVNRKLSEAKAKGYGDEHPEIVALNDQAARLRELIKQAQNKKLEGVELQANQGLKELQHRVADLEVASRSASAELGEIGGQLGRLEQIVKKMPGVEARYAELSRSYNVNKDLQSQLYDKLRNSQIQLEFQRVSAAARYEIIVPPRSYGIRIRVQLLLRAAIGAGLGLLVALLVILYRSGREFIRDLPKRQAQRLASAGTSADALARYRR
jgi:pSer/pThr/pTyr-binding forkhead associated (FHA) protein/uncharacterized protein involved in exopolysaccharide biosynthesis